MVRLESFAQRVETLCGASDDKALLKWLTNEDVCGILNVSKRTLQTYRDSGKLSYSQIGYKIYYSPEDVEQLIKKMGRG